MFSTSWQRRVIRSVSIRPDKGHLIFDLLPRRLIMATLLLYVESPFSMFVNLTLLQTDEQAPLPGALSQLLERVTSTYESAGDFIFNCQMGRRWTTTGMVSVCLIATAMNLKRDKRMSEIEPDSIIGDYNTIDGPSEEEAYLQGNVLSNQTVQVELTILQENIKSFCGLSVSPPTERR